MSNDKRLTILETVNINISNTLIDIKAALQRQSDKIDALDKKLDTKIDALDKKIDNKIDTLDKKFDSKFDNLNNRMWSNFLWLMSTIIGLAGLIAHLHHLI